MAVLIYGDSKLVVEELLKKEITKEVIENYNFNELSLLDIYKIVTSEYLFAQPQIIIHDFDLLQTKNVKLKKREKQLLSTILTSEQGIFILEKELNPNNEIYLQVKEKVKYLTKKSSNQNLFTNFIKENKIKISKSNLEYLSNNLNNEQDLIINELLKLVNYTNNKEITKEVIDIVSYKSIEVNIFSIFTYYLQNKVSLQYQLYKQIKEQAFDSTGLLMIFLKQFQLIHKIDLLQNQGYQSPKIAQLLNVHPYRTKKICQELMGVKRNKIKKKYLQLAKMEYLVKSGQIDPEIAMDLIVYS